MHNVIKQKLEEIKNDAILSLNAASTTAALYEVKVKVLGKQGSLSTIMREMGQLSKEERPAFGQLVNEVKTEIESHLAAREEALKAFELQQRLERETLDLTLPGPAQPQGAVHPIHHVTGEIVSILSRLGYSVRTGPWIETERHNFEALNMPAGHPARDMQDTFYIRPDVVLRTHTSPVQIRTMESEEPPIRILAPGGVFRKDSDSSHSPHFHQIECLHIDQKISMADLKGTVAFFVREFFGRELKTRFRPSFFPFTEPSAEMDCQCPLCKGKGCRLCKSTGWVEIGGCGLVHPNVFKASGIEYPRWQGFAFGFGIERMAIIKYGIDDIRHFFENDVRFLRQFQV